LEGEAGIRDVETNVAVYGTNNWDQVENLWVECDSGALVWLGDLEADQGIEAEVVGVHQQEPQEHPVDLVAKKNL